MPDIPPFEMPEGALSNTDQILPSQIGYLGLGTPGGETTAITGYCRGAYAFSDGTGLNYFGTITSLYKQTTGGGTITDISRASSTDYGASSTDANAANWEFAEYGDWKLATNGYDVPQVLKVTNFQDLAGAPPAAKFMLIFGERLILGNLSLSLSRGTTATSVANSYFKYKIAGVYYTKTATVAGTALAAGTIPQNKYGLYRFTIDAAGTITCTPAAANFTTGYNSAALAIAAIPAVPANNAEMGYIVVMSTNAAGFVGNTDALMGGTGGNPAAFTNYYVDCTIRSDKMLYWSALADLENWTPSATTGCGYQDMPDMIGEITGIAAISGGFTITSENSISVGWLSRGTDVFNFTLKEQNIGCRAYTVQSANHGIFGMSYRDFIFFDGNTARSIGDGVRYNIFGAVGVPTGIIPVGAISTISMILPAVFSSCQDPTDYIIYWTYFWMSDVGSYSKTITYNWKLGQFTLYQSQDTTAGDAYIINHFYHNPNLLYQQAMVFVIATTVIWRYGYGTAGTSGYLTTREISLRGEDGEMKTIMITGVRPRISGYSTAVAVTTYSRMNEDDTPLETTATIATSSSTSWADLRATGRYHKIKTTLSGGVIKTIDVKYQVAGTR